jgi:hypothetical protein
MTPTASRRAAADILLAEIRSATPVDPQQLQKLSLGASSAENEQDDQCR